MSQRQLLEHQLALMCRVSPSAMRGGIGAAGVIAWIVGTRDNLYGIAGWVALLIAVHVSRAYLQSYYMRNSARLDPQRWLSYFIVGLVVNGFVWSVPEIWLVPADPAAQTVLAILVIGIAATAIASLAPVRHAYPAFLLPFMAPIALSYLWLDENYRMVALGIVLFIVAMLRIARNQHEAMTDLLRLQLDLRAQIAQREETEAELRVAKAQAEAASRAKSQFLANMSHELRTPLNGILGMSELLMRETSGKQLRHASTVRSAGLRLLRIINDILDLARLEAGTLQISPSPLAPRALTDEVIELLADQAGKKGIELRCAIDPNVPDYAISDAGRIQQVLSNLIDNAIKFSTRGVVDIRVEARSIDDHRAQLRWAIRDCGPGIPEEDQEKLFKPFSQLDGSATRKFGGTGLGLAISRQLVEALGGRIGLASVTGNGTTFWFEVPVEVVTGTTESNATAAAPAASLRSGRVLIVEDNPINRELAAEILQAAGYSIATANDGEQALHRLASETFDLVLMDWHMPVLDGLAATRKLRELERAQGRSRVPVIALTASVLPGDREACEAAGMDGFLPKPFSFHELVEVLDHWLGKKAA